MLEFRVGDATESDHLPIILTLNGKNEKDKPKRKIRDWGKFKNDLKNDKELDDLKKNLSGILEKIKNKQLDITTIRQQIDECVTKFTNVIKKAQISSTTERTIKSGGDFKIKKDTRDLIKERKKLIDLIKKNRNTNNVEVLKNKMNQITRKMKSYLKRDKHDDYEKKSDFIAKTNDSRRKWKIFNQLMERKKKDNNPLTHLKMKDNKLTTTTKEIVNTHVQRLKETHQVADWKPVSITYMLTR